MCWPQMDRIMNVRSFPGVFLLVDWGISQNAAKKNTWKFGGRGVLKNT